ncbi:hypothetical protein GCM10009836_29530 [Pseudonocardia ailaonensis]|uniref:Cupin domain-containing protein n=1 Tax=Pseudonocardia ailaonensis TaxID=367279 RepID=A0ABN2N2X6_9PSEU
MTTIVTVGVENGRSSIRSVRTPEIALSDGAVSASDQVHRTIGWPPELAKGTPHTGPVRPVKADPGEFACVVVEFAPDAVADPHRTTTLDHDVILRGSVVLGTDEDSVELRAGDVAVVEAAVHSWRAGPDGVSMVVSMVALPDGDR